MRGFRRRGKDLPMSSEEIVLSVKNLSKHYEIYDKPSDRLKQFIFPKIARLFGRTPKKYYREFAALNNVSFEIKKGETVGIIGRNGSGKSTLLQIICGTLAPTTGLVKSKGRIAALLELGSGFNPEFTGRENVRLSAMIMGLSAKQVDEKMAEIIEFADIGDFIDQPVRTYSSGMFMRLAFSVQAHIDPQVLIVDEALAVGDFRFQAKCYALLNDLARGGCTIFFVSHDIGLVQRLCNRALFLSKGESKYFGPTKVACEHYLIEEWRVQKDGGTKLSLRQHININKHVFSKNALSHRMGDKKFGEIYSVLLNDNFNDDQVIKINEAIKISISFAFHEHVKKPILAIYIVDSTGQLIVGTNSSIEGLNLAQYQQGSSQVMTIEFINRLRVGEYALQVYLAKIAANDITIYTDYFQLLLPFKVINDKNSDYWAAFTPIMNNVIHEIYP